MTKLNRGANTFFDVVLCHHWRRPVLRVWLRQDQIALANNKVLEHVYRAIQRREDWRFTILLLIQALHPEFGARRTVLPLVCALADLGCQISRTVLMAADAEYNVDHVQINAQGGRLGSESHEALARAQALRAGRLSDLLDGELADSSGNLTWRAKAYADLTGPEGVDALLEKLTLENSVVRLIHGDGTSACNLNLPIAERMVQLALASDGLPRRWLMRSHITTVLPVVCIPSIWNEIIIPELRSARRAPLVARLAQGLQYDMRDRGHAMPPMGAYTFEPQTCRWSRESPPPSSSALLWSILNGALWGDVQGCHDILHGFMARHHVFALLGAVQGRIGWVAKTILCTEVSHAWAAAWRSALRSYKVCDEPCTGDCAAH